MLLQVDAAKYKSLANGFKVTIAEEGIRGLAKGWAPTLIGYSMQGLCKFGFYEVSYLLRIYPLKKNSIHSIYPSEY